MSSNTTSAEIVGAQPGKLQTGDVAGRPLAGLSASYVLDVGCFYGLPLEEWNAHAAGDANSR